MSERGGRYEGIYTGNEVYSTQALQQLKIEQLEQEIAVLKQRNADLKSVPG
jgi:cell division protein FtsB